ncbi:hypothetical protein [Acidocella facilis]|uniref:hypothetical protein n=1 Tax=Acidocella facilis TaxID=525 RepID=UPI000A621CAC|nr:hypothetical protein [Acidocella facilis]
MDAVTSIVEPSFEFDLAGRVRNLGLPASAVNSLIPLFEAVSNGLHAIEARWKDDATRLGQVTIEIHRSGDDDGGGVTGFTVTDNGIGLNETNWRSFLTSDSPMKIARGGKGVGRLGWLKAFSDCRITSRFDGADGVMCREFGFALRDGPNPIHGHVLTREAGRKGAGTEVRLMPFQPNFEAYCPKKAATIAAKLVGHFLNYFALGKLPHMVITDGAEVINLGKFFSDNQQRNDVKVIDIQLDPIIGPSEFQIYHVLLHKQLKFLEGGNHWMFYAGNERVAYQEQLDSQLGLKYVGENSDCVYVGLVTGSYLDGHVNQERTNFTFGKDRMAEIHKAAIASAKEFLGQYIDRIREQQVETTSRIIRDNPQFLPFRDALPEFVEKNLSLNTQGDEEIFLELSRRKLRAKRQLDGQLRSLKENGPDSVQGSVEKITKALNDEKKSSLAEYVVRRKAILDLLDSSLAFKEPEKRRYYKEEVIHELIVPLRSSSEELDYNQHNLWILDDRLAFYSFFRSDKPFSTFTEGDSGREPDLAVIFEPSLAFRREGSDEPVVIIEFKRPGRTEYDQNSNPVTQVLEYVDLFRAGNAVTDKNGRVIKPITPATRFVCFVIADFTDNLKKVLRYSVASHPTADGEGFFGVSTEHNASIEVLPYSKILHDAKVRNEAFFRHLGLG